MAMKTLVTIPTYNEAENIQAIISKILSLSEPPDILIVDDNSPDGTAQIVEKEFSLNGRVHLLRREKKLGIGSAYRTAFRYGLEGGYSGLIGMDADFSHDPLVIPQLEAASANYDMVIGSRYVNGGTTIHWGALRKFLSRGANLTANYVLSLSPRDCTSGFRFYHARALQQLDFESIQADGYSFLVEIVYRASRRNLRIGEIPIRFADRQKGKSKISRKEIFNGIQTILRLRFRGQN